MAQKSRQAFRKKGKEPDHGALQNQQLLQEAAERYQPDISAGLTAAQVKSRVAEGFYNGNAGIKTKSEKQIILENTFTFFNTINFILAILVILVGSYKNTLFMGVILCNAVIGSFQEIRSKRIIDKLSLISAPKAS
ncbi:MAG: hypothetical protein RSC76_01810, partial [Oscillospiraceae bacterium]